jgi:transposase
MVSRKAHPAELRERAVQMVFDVRAETGNERGPVARVGHQLGINTETLRNWVNKAEVDSGQRPGTTTGDKKRITELEREVRELCRANEILKAASAYFAREPGPRHPRWPGSLIHIVTGPGSSRPARSWKSRHRRITRRRNASVKRQRAACGMSG